MNNNSNNGGKCSVGSGSTQWFTVPFQTNGGVTINTDPYQISFDFGLGQSFIDPIFEEQAKVKIGNAEGYICKCCEEFYPMAEINMPDKTFKCYSCRKGLSAFFKK